MTPITTQAPVRVDLAGGTLDIWPIYAVLPGCMTVNLAIDRYQRVEITPADRWRLENPAILSPWETPTLQAEPPSPWTLVWQCVQAVPPPHPVSIRITSDVPPGSGLGGSSALCVALLGALHQLRGHRASPLRLVREAMFVETRCIQVPTGLQDYLAAAYGGCHAWVWTWNGWQRRPLHDQIPWILDHLMVVYIGESRFSGQPNWEVFQRFITGDPTTRRAMAIIRDAARQITTAIRRRSVQGVAAALRQEMEARAHLHPDIVTPPVERILSWREPGIHAAKVCGAGGGGSVLLWIEPAARTHLISSAQARGWTVLTPLSAGISYNRMMFARSD